MENTPEHIAFENSPFPDGFGADKEYFSGLEAILLETLAVEQRFGTKEDGLSPDSEYLNTLENKIFERLSLDDTNSDTEREHRKDRSPVRHLSIRTWLTTAATIILLIGLFMVVHRLNTPAKPTSSLGVVDLDSLYMEQNILFLSNADLEFFLGEYVFDMEVSDDAIDEELFEYLIQNEINAYEEYDELQ